MTVSVLAGVRPHATIRRRTALRRRGVLVALAALVGLLFLADVLLGWYVVSLTDFVRILRGTTIPGASFIVMDLRLPRALVATLVGLALGVSGALFQSVLRNPLASPDIVGVTAGASTSAVFAIVVLGWSGPRVSLVAFVGTLAVALLVYALAHRPHSSQLVVTGVAVASLLYALTSYLLTRAEIWTASDALVWLSGSLRNSSWPVVCQLALVLAVLLPVAGLLARRVAALELGDDTAVGLGAPAARSRALLLLSGVALTAVATAAAGPIAFVAFVSGPISRRLMHGRTSVVAAALVGATVVLAADFVSANLTRDLAVPVGVVTGALGAPFLLLLLGTGNRLGKGA